MKSILALLLLSWTLVSCITARVSSTDNSTVDNIQATNNTTLTIFLLERDIPTEIERLGVVTIPVGQATVDKVVKEKLMQKCRELGANGAYRISDGFYPNSGMIPYLVFKYKK